MYTIQNYPTYSEYKHVTNKYLNKLHDRRTKHPFFRNTTPPNLHPRSSPSFPMKWIILLYQVRLNVLNM